MFRSVARALVCAGIAVLGAHEATAQSFPSRPIKLVVGFGAGGGADGIARLYALKLQDALKTPVVVENKPGAYEQIAGQTVMGARPDGYTLWLATTGGLVQAPLMKSLPYNPQKDFTPISVIAEADAVLAVRPALPAKSIDELVRYAQSNPGVINYGSAGTGAPSHLLVEYIQAVTNTKMTHIPFKSAGDVVRELAGGTIDFAVAVPASAVPLIHDGRIRGISVTGPQRNQSLPNVPTLQESTLEELKGMNVYAFYGILGPAGLPSEITKALNSALNSVSGDPGVQKNAIAMHFRPVAGSAEDFSRRIDRETSQWNAIAERIR